MPKPDLGLRGLEHIVTGAGSPCGMMIIGARLKDKVAPDALKKAVSMALSRNWAYRTSFSFTPEGLVDFYDNDAEPPVFFDDGRYYSMGSTETNGYLFVILYDENRITMRTFHAVTDGKGQGMFFQAVIYNYFSLIGENPAPDPSVLTPDSPEEPGERALSFEDTADPDAAAGITEEEKYPVYEIKEERSKRSEEGLTRLIRLTCSSRELIGLAKQNGGTLTGLLMAICGRAIYETYGKSDDTIKCLCTVDKRKFWGYRALSNFSGAVNVRFTPDLNEKPLSEVCMDQTRILKEMNTKERLAFSGQRSLESGQIFRSFPIIPLAQKFKEKASSPDVTYTISNVGSISMGADIDEKIESFEVKSPIFGGMDFPGFITYSFKDSFTILSEQNFESDELIRKIARQLEEFGVSSTVEDLGWARFDSLIYDRIKERELS